MNAEVAEGLLPWMIALFVIALVGYVLHWRTTRGGVTTTHKFVPVVLVVAALVAAVGTTVQVGRIGHSGAKAAWDTPNNTR